MQLRFTSISLFLLLTVHFGCDSTSVVDSPSSNLTYLNHSQEAQYVGMEACKSCHTENHKTFAHSEMGLSMKPAFASKSAAHWNVNEPIFDPHKNLYYLPFKRGEQLFLKEFRLKGKDTVFSRVEQIDFIVGSGQHTNSHFIEENGYLFQAPITWYSQDGKWDLPPGFEDGDNSRFSRAIELECMTCHNGLPKYVANSGNKYESIPSGIDCERCHGPGSVHVDFMEREDYTQLKNGIDYTIVHPGKLGVDLQFDICQRCHLQGTAVPKNEKAYLEFRPGTPLSNYINVFLPRYSDSLDNFIMASHPDRLRMSSCFKASHEAGSTTEPMTCISCHNPHVSIKTLPQDHYNQQCQKCHQDEKTILCSLDEGKLIAADYNCIKCHMPGSGSSDIPHVKITDHFIRKEVVLNKKEVNEVREFVQLVCRTDPNPSPLLMAKGYLAYCEQYNYEIQFLDSAEAYLKKASRNSTPEELISATIQLKYLQGEFKDIIEASQTTTTKDAWTNYRIGEAFAQTNQAQKAIEYYQKAIESAPDHLQFRKKLATTLVQTKQSKMAIDLLDKLIADYPKLAGLHNNRGFAQVQMGNWEAAESDFKKELQLDPDPVNALANLASLYVNTDRAPEARPLVVRLLEIDPKNKDYQYFLKVIDGG